MSEQINITNTFQALALLGEKYHLILGRPGFMVSFCMVDDEVYNTSLNKTHDHAKIGKISRDEFVNILRPILKSGSSVTAAKDDDLYKSVENIVRENQDKFK